MIIKTGFEGIKGLGFETTEEVHVVTAAVMVQCNGIYIRDAVISNLAPGRLLNTVEWVADRLPNGKRLAELQKLGQQAVLNAELGDGPAQEARLDITREPELSTTAISALRKYAPWVQSVAYRSSLDSGLNFFVTTSAAMVEQINAVQSEIMAERSSI